MTSFAIRYQRQVSDRNGQNFLHFYCFFITHVKHAGHPYYETTRAKYPVPDQPFKTVLRYSQISSSSYPSMRDRITIQLRMVS